MTILDRLATNGKNFARIDGVGGVTSAAPPIPSMVSIAA
jgi:hypothetical protein